MLNRLLARAALVFVACLLCRVAAAGCSMIIKPVVGFDDAEYVFTGRVMNLAGPFGSSEDGGEAWGLLINVEDGIHLPEPAGAFEVYPFELGSDCSDVPWEADELLKTYPFGTQVRVVARRAKAPASGAPRLVVEYAHGILTHNVADASGGEVTTAASVYDYRKYKPYPDTAQERDERRAEAHYQLPAFELRKDLLRLKRAAGEAERVEILERLADYPGEHDFDFKSAAEPHVKDAAARARLLRRREERLAAQRPKP